MIRLEKCTLLISTYNWPEALELVLKSVTLQTVIPSEIIIADDGSTQETKEIIDSYKRVLNIKHVWHKDEGFRKTIIMNKAIREAENDYIVQIDGDIILHPKFIQDHLHFAKENHFIKGSRAMLHQNLTQEILKLKTFDFSVLSNHVRSKINATRIPFLAPLFFGNKYRTNNLRGCNFAFWKKDFILVNGYNNEINGWGHEDIELAARLVNNGTLRRQFKMIAVCFHLHHKINTREKEMDNLFVYAQTVKQNIKTIPNGYQQF
jgi:glycosyltransferase involved in cell wall biosynthesis